MSRFPRSLAPWAVATALLAIFVPAGWAHAPLPGTRAASVGDAVPGEFILQLSSEAFVSSLYRPSWGGIGRTGLPAVDQALAACGAQRIEPAITAGVDADARKAAGLDRIFLVGYAGGGDPRATARALSRVPGVAFAEPNGYAHALLSPNDTYYPNQWAHNNTGQAVSYGGSLVGTPDCDTDTDQAWDLQTGSSTLVLAIIDTGCDTGHPEFGGRVVAGYDFVNNDSNPSDDNGHGTCCAGIALGAGNNGQGIAGVAWGVKLMPVKVLNASGSGTYTAIANGINWAADNGAKILSLSLGGSANSTMEAAVNYAYGKGCAIFCATGNGNASSLSYPAAYGNSIGVGALSPCNERKSTTSCDGEYWWGSNYGAGIDFMAPGVRIHTADIRGSGGFGSGDYISDFNGTSSACPHAAGIGALVWSQNPSLTNAQMLSVLQTYCDDMGAAGYDTQTGYGRLNAHQAVLNAGGGPPPPPPPPPTTIFSEGFEVNTVPGSVWSATDANSTTGLDYWGDQSSGGGARVHGGSWSAYCADNSDRAGQQYDNNMRADMTLINAVGLTGYTGVTFSFWLWHSRYNSSDYVELQYWNGSSWVAQQRWTANTGGWVNPTYSVTGTSFRFRFYFYSNNSGRGEGSYVDDILITGTPAGLVNGDEVTTLALLSEDGAVEPAEWLAKSREVGGAGPDEAATMIRVAPNPARGERALSFALASPASIRLEVFSPTGRRVALLAERNLSAGPCRFSWDPGTLPAGVYFARLRVNGTIRSSAPVTVLR